MGGSVNKAILIGNLGRDPELKYTGDGRPVARFSLATSENWTSREGEKKEKTEWHKIVVWGKLASFCGEYLRKGRRIYVEGRIETRSYEDRERQQRTITEIIANQIVLLDSKGSGGGGGGAMDEGRQRPASGGPSAPAPFDDSGPADATDGGDFGGGDDDVPF